MTIHYNSVMPLTVLRAVGQGECGQSGDISGYHGMVNCKKCLEIIKKEKETTNTFAKSQMRMRLG